MDLNQEHRFIGIILARGGSKGVPGKNIIPLGGVPLIAYTICEALRSKFINRLIVSTDSPEIQRVAIQYGAEAPFLRPAEISGDNAIAHDACKHAVEWAEADEGQAYDFVIEMLCTNPMKTSEDIDACIEKLVETGADAVIGVTKLEDHHPIRIKKIVDDRIVDFCLPEISGSRRQDLKPDAYIRNGSIYASKRDCIYTRIGSKEARPYIMPEEKSANVDTVNDLLLAEILIQKYPRDYIVPPTNVEKSSSAYIPKSEKEKKVLVTSTPFGDYEDSPIDLFKEHKVDFTLNPLGRIPSEDEMVDLVKEYGVVLAGTSPFTARVMDAAPNLRLIARAGIGTDSVDLKAARERGIQVTYTPLAPAPAVAEFTIGLMLSLLRKIGQVDRNMRAGKWTRLVGRRIAECTVGLVGAGSIGKLVARYLSGFGTRIIAFDIKPDHSLTHKYGVQWVTKKELLENSDIVSIHIPLTKETAGLIGDSELKKMKSDAYLINTSRGGIVNEDALYKALKEERIAGAALDVFEVEPYQGPLQELDNCLLTAHMSAASVDCKRAMEMGAAEEIIRYLSGKRVKLPVPDYLY